MDAMTIALLVGGIVVLVAGGELLVRGASRLAGALGMSPLVIGLTIVAFATSAPELAVTVDAVLKGSPDLAVGNVVGSNIANILLVLGIAAVIGSLVVGSQLVRVDVPVMVAMSVLLLVLCLDGVIGRPDGFVLLACLLGYLIFTLRMSRRETSSAAAKTSETASGAQGGAPREKSAAAQRVVDVVLIVVGVGALVIGAQWLVEGATMVATELGLPDMVIGLTIVAVGTSLPELSTTIIAAVRGERQMAIGNAVGSNIFNIGAVLGVGAVMARGGIPVSESAIRFDLPIMVATSLALLPVIYTGFEISRWEGFLFVGLYLAYTTYLLLYATDHERLPAFSGVMLWFVLPTVTITLGVLAGFDAGLRKGRVQGLEMAQRGETIRVK